MTLSDLIFVSIVIVIAILAAERDSLFGRFKDWLRHVSEMATKFIKERVA